MERLGPFDIVFCRNVLIYFDQETKQKILREIHGTLFRGGRLLLGDRKRRRQPTSIPATFREMLPLYVAF